MQQSVSQLASVGDPVFVNVGERSVRTTLLGFLEGDRFLTQAPVRLSAPLEIEDNRPLLLQFPRQSCAYSVSAVKEGVCVRDGVELYQFRAVSEIERVQRRRAYRLAARLDAEATPLSAGVIACRCITLNLSEKGLCLSGSEQIRVGQRLRLRLDLREDGLMTLYGEAVRSERVEDAWLTGVCFDELPQWKQAHLIKYIMKRQLELSRNEVRRNI